LFRAILKDLGHALHIVILVGMAGIEKVRPGISLPASVNRNFVTFPLEPSNA
jgi:hypothetical protein